MKFRSDENQKAWNDLQEINGVLNRISQVASDDIAGVRQLLIDLSARQSNLNYQMGQAQYLLNKAYGAAYEKHKGTKIPSTVTKKVYDAECSAELSIVAYAESIQKSIGNAISALSTVLSELKVEMQALNNHPT